MRNFKFVMILMLSLVFVSTLLHADIYLKQTQHMDAMTVMGQTRPAQDVITETWITDTKMAVNSEKQQILIDLEAKTITMADHEKETMMSMPLDFSKAAESAGKTPGEQAQMQEFMKKMMDLNVTIEPTNETKTINDWNCRKYVKVIDMGMGKVTADVWATTDININEELYDKFSAAMMAQMPGMADNLGAIEEEMEKIKGVQVYVEQTNEVMGQTVNSTVELLEYKEGNAPADAFELPSDYSQQPMY